MCTCYENGIYNRVMIEYHLKIQLFTTQSMWQGGPYLNLFLKNKKIKKFKK
jgi:hypothetical protein